MPEIVLLKISSMHNKKALFEHEGVSYYTSDQVAKMIQDVAKELLEAGKSDEVHDICDLTTTATEKRTGDGDVMMGFETRCLAKRYRW